MEIGKDELVKYIRSIKEIRSPAGQTVYLLENLIPDIPYTIDLLIAFLESREDIPGLETLSNHFFEYLRIILDSNLKNYTTAINGLATKFEPFLKKIGFFIYGDSDYYLGSTTHKGIRDSTLNNLIQGCLPPLNSTPKGTPGLQLPTKLLNNTGFKAELTTFIRTLRNEVHLSKQIEPSRLVVYVEYLLLGYLLVIEDNAQFLADNLLPANEYKSYLAKHYQKWESQYFRSQLLERDVNELVDLSPSVIETDWDAGTDDGPFVPKQGKILDILTQVKRLVLIGDPGLGKTTTLQFLGSELSKRHKYLPLYFPIKDFIARRALLTQIAEYGDLPLEIIEGHADRDLVAFLLDGANEVLIKEDAIDLVNQVKSLMRQFKNSYFVVTTRTSTYRNDFLLPVFELQPLTNIEIGDFIRQNYPQKGEPLIQALEKQHRLIELCRNPLILVILCSLTKGEPALIPANKGLILKAFIDNILRRESEKNSLFDVYRHKRYLIEIAANSRMDKKISFGNEYVLNCIGELATAIEPSANRLRILDTLIELGVLQRSNGQVSFIHELFQEYLAAEGILTGIIPRDRILLLSGEVHWEQPIVLYSGLVDSHKDFILEIAHLNPMLSIKCLESSISEDEDLRSRLVVISFENAKKIGQIELASNSLQALLKLGESGLVTRSIADTIKEHGKIAFRFFGQIASVLIKNIDLAFLIDSVKLILGLGKNFMPVLIRNLERRNPDDIIKVRDELLAVCENYIYEPARLPFAYRFFKLIDLKDPDKLDRKRFDRYCFAICQQNYATVANDKNIALNLIRQLEIYNDRDFILKVIDKMLEGRNTNVSLLLQILSYRPELTEVIIDKCIRSEKVGSVCVGMYLINNSELHVGLKKNVPVNPVYQNPWIRYKMNGVKTTRQLQDRISEIVTHQNLENQLQALIDDERPFISCKVHSVGKESYSLKIKNKNVSCRILREELENPTIEKGDDLRVKLAFVDWVKQTAYFTTKTDSKLDYINLTKSPIIGAQTIARVVTIGSNKSKLVMDLYYPILISTDKLPAGIFPYQRLTIKLLSIEKGVYSGVILSLPQVKKKQSQTGKSESPRSNPKTYSDKRPQNKPPSDFADVLKKALDKG